MNGQNDAHQDGKTDSSEDSALLMELLGLAGLHPQQAGAAFERLTFLRHEGLRRQQAGAAFERLIQAHLAPLIQQGQVITDYMFAAESREGRHRVVELALWVRNAILPIDAKYIDTEGRAVRAIEDAIIGRAGEVRKYVRPPYTLPLALVIVDDTVWTHALSVQGRLLHREEAPVLLVSVSNVLPLLAVILALADLLGTDMHAALQVQRMVHRLHEITDGVRAARDIQQQALDRLEALSPRYYETLAASE